MELEFLTWLRNRAASAPEVVVGIGDDAAVITPHSQADWVVTTDALAERTHFISGHHAWPRIGRKALAVSLSDIAAMGGSPRYALIQLQLPNHMSLSEIQEMYVGAEQLAREFGVTIVGGDTNRWTGELVIGTTVIGLVPRGRQWTIGGAQAGDRILVTGPLGGSILGGHLDFEPRCRLAEYLQARFTIHAATDISDSLTLDLSTMCTASGLGATLHADAIPIAEAAHRRAQETGLLPLEHALTDGEDFEILFSVAPDMAQAMLSDEFLEGRLFEIGEFSATSGMYLLSAAGTRQPLVPRGYEH